eukprot:TRINITY_DN30459_c0_g1_i1.p1 TRINITY_DN30459_c0_g1~~TRINITY_DN30459_c0_g1_i1.p1  ORF type:complete len:182 (+),score=52.49 TRINITY_DN30459_c0_g1_i1:44-589(+)
MADTANGKHPLEHKWTMWYDSFKKQDPDKSWEENLMKVSDFDTVEDFWSTYNHIKRPTSLEYGANYHVFKSGIKPMWEDPANKEGGRFIIAIQPSKEEALNETWEHLLLAMIGEYVEDGVAPIAEGHVTGAALGRRKAQTKISVWTRDKTQGDALEELKQRLLTLLQLGSNTSIKYEPHEK